MQTHECGNCGHQQRSAKPCQKCERQVWPVWNVMDSLGRCRGTVLAPSEKTALEIAADHKRFARLHALTVRPKE